MSTADARTCGFMLTRYDLCKSSTNTVLFGARVSALATFDRVVDIYSR